MIKIEDIDELLTKVTDIRMEKRLIDKIIDFQTEKGIKNFSLVVRYFIRLGISAHYNHKKITDEFIQKNEKLLIFLAKNNKKDIRSQLYEAIDHPGEVYK